MLCFWLLLKVEMSLDNRLGDMHSTTKEMQLSEQQESDDVKQP